LGKSILSFKSRKKKAQDEERNKDEIRKMKKERLIKNNKRKEDINIEKGRRNA
jgi:uncharacterized ubiquitin-like protein YukD